MSNGRASLLVVISCFAVISCDVGETDDPDEELAFSGSVEPAFWYNANPFKPTNGAVPYECIWPALGRDASPAAHFVNGQPAFSSWRAVDFTGTTFQPGQLRVARWERVSIAG